MQCNLYYWINEFECGALVFAIKSYCLYLYVCVTVDIVALFCATAVRGTAHEGQHIIIQRATRRRILVTDSTDCFYEPLEMYQLC